MSRRCKREKPTTVYAYALYFNNNYAYVGISYGPEHRIAKGHIGLLNDNKHYNRFMQRVYNKYGLEHYYIWYDEPVPITDKRACNMLEARKYREVAAIGWHMTNLVVPGGNLNRLYDFEALQESHRVRSIGMSERMQEVMSRPEVRAKISASTKAAMWRTDVRERYLIGMAAIDKDEWRQTISATTKAAMQRPDVKQRHLDAIHTGQRTKQAYANYSKSHKAVMQRPGMRETVSVATKAGMAKPGVSDKIRKGMAFAHKYGQVFKVWHATEQLPDYLHFIQHNSMAIFFVWDTREVQFAMPITEVPEYRVARLDNHDALVGIERFITD